MKNLNIKKSNFFNKIRYTLIFFIIFASLVICLYSSKTVPTRADYDIFKTIKPLQMKASGQFFRLLGKFLTLIMIAVSFDASYGQTLNFVSNSTTIPQFDEQKIKTSNNLSLQVINSKLVTNRQMKLELTIEGRGILIKSTYDNIISLNGQPVLFLSSYDLAPYFDLDNLEFNGYSKEEYEAQGLPDGTYKVCFQMFDNTSDTYSAWSPSTCLVLWAKKDDVPIIISPTANLNIDQGKPFNFTWMPRHTSAIAPNYEFEIYEYNSEMTYQDIMLYQSPVIQFQSSTPFYLLPAKSAILKSNGKYFCIVKISDRFKNVTFKNGGYSAPVYFIYGEKPKILASTNPACLYPNGKVFINEISQGCFGTIGDGTQEYVEIVAVGQGNESFVDLEGYIIDDNNFPAAEIGNEPGHIRLGSCFNAVPRGTVILLYNQADLNPLINPANDNKTGGPGFWQIPFNDPCLIKYSVCPNQSYDGYGCGEGNQGGELWNNYIPMRNTNDVLQIRNKDLNLEHSILWITSSYEYSNNSKNVTISGLPSNNQGQSTADGTTFAFVSGINWNDPAAWVIKNACSSESTPGLPNSEDNASLINMLKTSEGSNDFYISCSPILIPSRGAKIDIHPSVTPSNCEIYLNGTLLTTTTLTTYYATNLQPGVYNIKVIELSTGCEALCVTDLSCEIGKPCDDFNQCTTNDVIINTNCECKGVDLIEVEFEYVEVLCDDILADINVNGGFDCCLQATVFGQYNSGSGCINGCSGWLKTNGSPDSWRPPLNNNQNPVSTWSGLAQGMISSPQGTAFLAAGAWFDDGEGFKSPSFPTVVGQTYSLSFYQSFAGNGPHATAPNRSVLGDSACWQIKVNNQNPIFSPTVRYQGAGDQTWSFVTLNFVAESTSSSLFFNCKKLGTGNNNRYYVAIDDVQLTIGDIPCSLQDSINAVVDTVICEGPYTYLWSNGSTNQGINITGLGEAACFDVTVTCANGCSYTGTYGENCGCIVGTPCPDQGPCLYEGVYDANCNCPDPQPTTDSDGDGICDELDQCPGEPDEDFDGDGIIDCEDPEVSCDSLTASLEVTPIVPGTCDYVVNLDSLLGNQNAIDINKILLHIDQKSYVIEGSQYNLPICFGNQQEQSFFVNHENFDAIGGGATYFWNGVPNDAKRVKENAVTQEYSMRLRDNSEFSLITSNQFSVNGFQNVRVEFSFVSQGFEVFSQNFVLEVSYDGGQTYQLVRKWNFDSHFKNGIRKNVSELINLPSGTNFAKLRIKCDATDDDNELFIDNIYIAKLKSSCSKELAKQKLKQAIEKWLLANSFSGIVSYLDANQAGDTICPKKGLNLKIDQSNIIFDAILAQNSYVSTQQGFCPVSCTGPVTSNTAYEVNVINVNCEQPTYLWSNGSTADSLIIGSLAALQSVTVTCANGCDTILAFGEGYCQFGDDCDPLGECYNEGFLNEFCDCIPTGVMNDADEDGICDEEDPCPLSDNHVDADGDGVPDCSESCPPLELYFIYKPISTKICDLCIDIDNLDNADLDDVVITNSTGENISLKDSTAYFKFPYCYSITEPECTYGDPLSQGYTVKPSLKKFISNLYAWGIRQSADFSVRLQTSNACSGTNKGILIKGSDFQGIQFVFANSPRNAKPANCRIDTLSYDLCLDPLFMPNCDELTYSWSNGESTSCVVVSDTIIGMELTIVCDGCTYTDNPPNTNCFVGKPCDDYNNCTLNDHYDANCICVGDLVPDSDDDTVCDSLDVCDGADDLLDWDNDGVPNCLDTCGTLTKVCKYCVDLIPQQIQPCYSAFGFSYINNNGTVININFPTVNVCPNDPISIQQLINAINIALQANGIRGKAVSSGNDCSPFGVSISIVDSDVKFVELFVKGLVGGTVNSLPFHEICEDKLVTSCDDGNPCTINDQYDANCNCIGTCVDMDDDGICDGDGSGSAPCDLCPQGPDYIDFNSNGIPDACDMNLFECEGKEITYCEYLEKMKVCSEDRNKVFEFDLRLVSNELREFFSGVNFNPTHFNIPQLMDDLTNFNDEDNDGIVDYLDPCPKYTNEFDSNGRIPLGDLMNCCKEVPYDPLRMSLLLNWMFKPVNWINEELGIYPSCANELNKPVHLDEDGDMVTEQGCEIEFFVDCNCKCDFKILDDIDNDGKCGKLDSFIVIDPPCDGLICPPAGTPDSVCIFYTIENCECVRQEYEDSDGDDICDRLDVCEGEPDVDSDGDGIMDCVDPCNGPVTNHYFNPEIPDPVGPGDPCDDGDPCTYADVVGANCGCAGVIVDVDGDGMTDCGECKIFFTNLNVPGSPTIEVSDRGPFEENCDGCYTIYNTDPNKPCDICPDMDDALDYNSNGVPDCIDKPFQEIGCPSGYEILPGVGLVLTFDVENPNDVKVEDLPSPISFASSYPQGVGNNIQAFDYLLAENLRIVSETQVQAIYPVPDIETNSFFSFVGISFASHQGCLFGSDTTSTDILADVNCPTGLGVDAQGNVIGYYDFGSATPDLLAFQGETSITFNTTGGTTTSTYDVILSNVSSSGSSTYSVLLGEAPTGTSPPFSFNSITLQNGIVCPYNNGVVQPCTNPTTGLTGLPGSPCTPNPAEPCKTHFRLDNNCNCIGDNKPDTDGDGLCDEIDPCPDFINANPDGSDCECDELVLDGDPTISNGSDVSIPFDMTNAANYSGVTITITGGPPGMAPIDTVLSNPLIVGNLPKGYAYTITITANCNNGGSSSIEIPVPLIPFESNPTFCGIEFDEVDLKTLVLLPRLNKGDVIKASDFNVTIREAKGSLGKFTGKGYIKVPYFEQVRINVNFKDIVISSNKQMISGYINVNGFGIAVLGDPISDVINDGINEIINVLEDLSDVLDELISVLEAAEELLATTDALVSQEKKKCVEDAKIHLKSLEVQADLLAQDPNATQAQKDDLVEQIKVASTVLKNCMDEYNSELQDIAQKYLNFLIDASGFIVDDCDANDYEQQFEDYLNSNNPFLNYQQDLEVILGSQNGSGFSGNLHSHKVDFKTQIVSQSIPKALNAYEYYGLETNKDMCITIAELKSKLNDVNMPIAQKISLTVDLIKATSLIGKELSQIIKEDLLNNVSHQMIYSTHKEEIHNSFKSLLIFRIYNINGE